MSLTSIVSSQTPAGAAKLTLEVRSNSSCKKSHWELASNLPSALPLGWQGLEHWRERLTSDLARLLGDIETSEALAERWCGKCADGLHELRLLHDQKQKHLEQVLKAIADLNHEINCAAIVAKEPGVAPLLLVPRRIGHPSTGALLQSAKSPPSSLYSGTPAHNNTRNTREMSRNVARQSAILVNSPDPSRKIVFS